jgi:hypothetical protein
MVGISMIIPSKTNPNVTSYQLLQSPMFTIRTTPVTLKLCILPTVRFVWFSHTANFPVRHKTNYYVLFRSQAFKWSNDINHFNSRYRGTLVEKHVQLVRLTWIVSMWWQFENNIDRNKNLVMLLSKPALSTDCLFLLIGQCSQCSNWLRDGWLRGGVGVLVRSRILFSTWSRPALGPPLPYTSSWHNA